MSPLRGWGEGGEHVRTAAHALHLATASSDNERTGTPTDGHPTATSRDLGVERLRTPRIVDRPAAREQKRMDLSEEIPWFGNLLNFGVILTEKECSSRSGPSGVRA